MLSSTVRPTFIMLCAKQNTSQIYIRKKRAVEKINEDNNEMNLLTAREEKGAREHVRTLKFDIELQNSKRGHLDSAAIKEMEEN